MIAYLTGTLLEKRPNQAILDVHGVGYDLTISVSTYSALPDPGEALKMHVHTHVREDALSLFGFLTREDKLIFEKLISVSGIGPKLAVTILSGVPTAELIGAIRSADKARLKVPGVGPKTAERIVLELRDKLDGFEGAETPTSSAKVPPLNDLEQDVLSALLNLGCQRAAAEASIRKAVQTGTPNQFEPLFRKALELVR
jgi:Holliday junction DNA helicase RuvA